MKRKVLKDIITEFGIQPDQGFAVMAVKMIPPKGYKLKSMERKGTKAVITWEPVKVRK